MGKKIGVSINSDAKSDNVGQWAIGICSYDMPAFWAWHPEDRWHTPPQLEARGFVRIRVFLEANIFVGGS